MATPLDIPELRAKIVGAAGIGTAVAIVRVLRCVCTTFWAENAVISSCICPDACTCVLIDRRCGPITVTGKRHGEAVDITYNGVSLVGDASTEFIFVSGVAFGLPERDFKSVLSLVGKYSSKCGKSQFMTEIGGRKVIVEVELGHGGGSCSCCYGLNDGIGFELVGAAAD